MRAREIALLAFLAACGKTQGAAPMLDEAISFDGGVGRDVVLPHGTKRWIVSAHCDRCNREHFGVDLRFAGNAPPPVEIWVDNAQGARNKRSGLGLQPMTSSGKRSAASISRARQPCDTTHWHSWMMGIS